MNNPQIDAAPWADLSREFQPIPRVDLTEEIIARIKVLIARGKLMPGSRLPPERELARLLSVGRPALRQALKALATMGIIESRVAQGTFISRATSGMLTAGMDFMRLLNAVTLPELFEVRKAVEVELAGLAAERAGEEELQLIATALENQEASLNTPQAFLLEDLNFHNAVAAAAHNALFTAILESLSTLMTEARRKLLMNERDLSHSLNDHRQIFREISGRNKSAARDAMFRHLDRVHHHWNETQPAKGMPIHYKTP